MDAREELIRRVARRRAERDHLSPQAYQELLLACRKDPASFIETDGDQAFARLADALDRNNKSYEAETMMDDEEYVKARKKRLDALSADCATVLDIDPDCVDAQLLEALAADVDPDLLVPSLEELGRASDAALRAHPLPNGGDAYDDVLLRPYLRVKASLARAYFDCARYRSAADACQKLIALSPSDALGARHTLELCDARLEDEAALDAVDQQFGRRGDSWLQLARVLLAYKLGRMGAARRALRGFDQLCTGGAYVLLRPILVDTYLPDRPEVEPYSFEEAILAVHEADPVVVDVPDFIEWAEEQPGFADSARKFARRNDLEW